MLTIPKELDLLLKDLLKIKYMAHISELNNIIPCKLPADRGTFNPSDWEVSWKMNIF